MTTRWHGGTVELGYCHLAKVDVIKEVEPKQIRKKIKTGNGSKEARVQVHVYLIRYLCGHEKLLNAETIKIRRSKHREVTGLCMICSKKSRTEDVPIVQPSTDKPLLDYGVAFALMNKALKNKRINK